MSSALATTAFLEMLPDQLRTHPANAKNRVGVFGATVAYFVMTFAARVIPRKWSVLPFEQREAVRLAVLATSSFYDEIDLIPARQRWVTSLKDPVFFVFMTSLRGPVRRLSYAMAPILSAEDEKARRVIERFENAPSEPASGDFVTLSAEQIRARAW
jgi:hypothetical protein